MAPVNSMEIIQRFESKVFRYGIILAIIFRVVRLVHEFLIDSPPAVLLLGAFNLILFGAVFLFYRKHFQISYIIFFFQILVTSILTWNNAGGWNGSVPYILFLALIGVVVTSHGVLQIFILFIYGLAIFYLSFGTVLSSFSPVNSNYSLLSREFDFMVNTAILILLTFYLKENFVSYRESVELTNERLRNSSEKLLDQTQQLFQQQVELDILRSNLEKIISGKINESQNKAEILKEYSFVNSHHVRAPLARVLGLIDLIEFENHRNNISSDALQKIKNDAEEIDLILKKINKVIS
jgi:signal transduction histidine kinase